MIELLMLSDGTCISTSTMNRLLVLPGVQQIMPSVGVLPDGRCTLKARKKSGLWCDPKQVKIILYVCIASLWLYRIFTDSELELRNKRSTKTQRVPTNRFRWGLQWRVEASNSDFKEFQEFGRAAAGLQDMDRQSSSLVAVLKPGIVGDFVWLH